MSDVRSGERREAAHATNNEKIAHDFIETNVVNVDDADRFAIRGVAWKMGCMWRDDDGRSVVIG